jgi:Ca2+-binding EF-hand superfamily protein
MDLMALIGLGGCVIMRRLAFAFFAGSIVACSVVNTASAQFRMEFQASPQGGPPGGFGGPPPGGFGGGQGGFGGRGDRGGFGGGGNFGRGGFDMGMMFDRISNGKPTIDVNTYSSPFDPQAGQKLKDYMATKGISGSQINRAQFTEYMNEQMAARMAARGGAPGGFGGPGAPGGPGGPPVMMGFGPGRGGEGMAPAAPQVNPEELARERFKQFDKNADGVLQPEEQPDFIKGELTKFDANKNGSIEFEEYKEFFKTQVATMEAQGALPGGGGSGTIEDELEKRPTMFRAGKLPKDLPSWFEKLDKDKDGQVGLYEWKADSRTFEEFRQLDFNGDGFITIDECLRNNRILAKKAGVPVGTTPVSTTTPPPSGMEKKDGASPWANFFKGRGDKGAGSGTGDKPEKPGRGTGERPDRGNRGGADRSDRGNKNRGGI